MLILDYMRKTVLTTFGMACLVSLAMSPAAMAQPAQRGIHSSATNQKVFRVTAATKQLTITERFSRVIELQNKITRVDGFDPEVIEVTALSPFQLRVQAKTPGVTTVVLADEFEQRYSIEVFIEGDARHLQASIDRLFPGSAVKAIRLKRGVVLRGWVSDPNHITEIVDIAGRFYPPADVLNQMKLGGVNQVQLSVKVMEVQRSRIRQLGFNWLWLGQNGYASSTPGSLTPLGTLALPFGGPASATAASFADPTLSFGVASANSVFQGFLEALKTEGLLKIKAEPRVTTTSGRPATLLAGGEFPILVPQGVGTVAVEWREFGVRLEAVPIVLGGGNLRLEIAPEVSDRDFSNAVQIQGFTVPGLTTRRVNTQVEMKFGQTLIIGGLITSRYTAETRKVPLLGELPWIGSAFRRMRYDENETELLIMVTPELVAPFNSDQVPQGGPGETTGIPTDRELYWKGMIEVPRYGNQGLYGSGSRNGCGNGGPGCGTLSAPKGQLVSPYSHQAITPLVPLESTAAPMPPLQGGPFGSVSPVVPGEQVPSIISPFPGSSVPPAGGSSVPPVFTPQPAGRSPFTPPIAPPAPGGAEGLIPPGSSSNNSQTRQPFPSRSDSVTQRYPVRPGLYSRRRGASAPVVRTQYRRPVTGTEPGSRQRERYSPNQQQRRGGTPLYSTELQRRTTARQPDVVPRYNAVSPQEKNYYQPERSIYR